MDHRRKVDRFSEVTYWESNPNPWDIHGSNNRPSGWNAAHERIQYQWIATAPKNQASWLHDGAVRGDVRDNARQPPMHCVPYGHEGQEIDTVLRSYVDIRNPDEGRASFSTRLNYGGPKGQSITTRSAAETFFARPRERLDGKSEAANLFRPYWQARLATQRWGAEPLEVAP